MDLHHNLLPPVQEILKPSLHLDTSLMEVSQDSQKIQVSQNDNLQFQSPDEALEDTEESRELESQQNYKNETEKSTIGCEQDVRRTSKGSLDERVSTLELHLKCRCNDISKEIKLVQAELNIITDWIQSKFDTSLIDKTSLLYRSLHKDIQDVDDISKSLLMISKLPNKSGVTANRRKSWGSNCKGTRSSVGSRANKKSNKSSQSKKLMFKGVLGTWIDANVQSNVSSKENATTVLVEEICPEIKEEQEDFMSHDPFEDGYIPEVDEDGNVDTTSEELPTEEGSRPKRSSTRNVSYDGFLESDEDEQPKRGKVSPRKKREKDIPSPSEDFSESVQDSKSNNSRKKYKPSEASTMRAKILANTPMMCDECGKVVKGPWTLKAHKEMHANIRRYTCHVCGYAFRRKPHLNAHLLLHEGVKHLKCQYCGRGFYLRRDLARHERTHTGEKPYNCTFPNCTKSFNVKQHLTMHYRTHTGERPYKCTVCEKSFSQANTLRIHKKLHEGGNPTVSRRKPRVSKANRGVASLPSHASSSASVLPPQSSVEGPLAPSSVECPPASPPISSNSTSTPVPIPQSSGGSQHDFRSPPPSETSISHHILNHTDSHSPFPQDTRQTLHNVVITNSSSSHPFDMITHSWRQGIATQASTLPGNHTTGLFLPQIYEPLNMHFSSYPPNNN